MSDYVTFNSISRAEPPGVPGGVPAGAAAGADDQTKAFQAGFEAGLRAAAEQQAPSREIAAQAGGGNLVGGMRDDGLYADSGFGANSFGTDPFGMNLGATGQSSFAMTGMPGFGQDPVAGVLQQLNQLMQLLTLFGQLQQMSQMQGGQSGMVTPIGMPGGNDFMRGGPGTDRLEPEMRIMPVGNPPENIGDMGDIGDVPPPSVDDPNLTAYERGVNERSRTGEGTIALETETRPSAEGYMAGPFSKEELGEILDYAMTDPTAMREAVSAELSGLEPPENVLAAFDELFDLLDAGDEDAFRNAFLNLARTDLGQFLVWGAVDVANDVRRGEMGGEEPGLDLDSEADIAEGLPINLDSDDVLAEDEPEAEAA